MGDCKSRRCCLVSVLSHFGGFSRGFFVKSVYCGNTWSCQYDALVGKATEFCQQQVYISRKSLIDCSHQMTVCQVSPLESRP